MHSCEYSVGSNDEIVHKLSDPILTIYNNEKIEDKLNVITVRSFTACVSKRTYKSLSF